MTFLAVDGEGIQDRYAIFGTRDETLISRAGLSFETVLDWLARRAQHRRIVAFAFHYDVCMLANGLSDASARSLLQSQVTTVGRWRVRYVPRHLLTATSGHTRLEVFDVWGFFQRSLEGALAQYGFVPDAVIAWGKRARGAFRWRDLRRIVAYNQRECQALEQLCDRLQAGMQAVGMQVRSWHGPGALADALLKRTRVAQSLRRPPDTLRRPIAQAYFGGRIETFQLGYFPSVSLYDLNSAYPAACRHLWDQSQGAWVRVNPRRIEDAPWSLWRVEWSLRGDRAGLGPLPFRAASGRIYFPACGRGWYWWPEVSMARRLHPREVRIIGGVRWSGTSPSIIAQVVTDLYTRRVQLQRDGCAVEARVLKLALNSLYGKFAQSVGKAPFQSPAWAGYITASVRAALREAVIGHEDRVIAFATDGILLRDASPRLAVCESEELGNWRREDGFQGWVLGSGLYYLWRGDEIRQGVRGGGIDWRQAIEQVNRTGFLLASDDVFISPLLAILYPQAFGAFRGKWYPRRRRVAPWLDAHQKRRYQFLSIRDWGRDSCRSHLLDGWPGVDSAPFDANWRGFAGISLRTRPELVLTRDEV